MAKRATLPKKYVKPLLLELLRDKEKREGLLLDLKAVSDPLDELRRLIATMVNKLNELRELHKNDDEALHITSSMGIYACFGWIIDQTEEMLKLLKDLQVDNEFTFMGDTLLEILKKEAKKLGYTEEEIHS